MCVYMPIDMLLWLLYLLLVMAVNLGLLNNGINREGLVLISSFYCSVDITPRTEGSRVVMMTLIVVSLAVLPSLLADVARTLQKRNGMYKLSVCSTDEDHAITRLL